jgi:Zn-dependent protease with chaperone function
MFQVGLPDGIFNTKNPDLGTLWRVLQLKMLIYFMAISSMYFTAKWYILWLFGVFFLFWYVLPRKIWQPWFQATVPRLPYR